MKETIWYGVTSWSVKIGEIEVIGETPKMLTLKETKGFRGTPRKTHKVTRWSQYFRTKAEAINHIHQRLKQNLVRSESLLKNSKNELDGFEEEYGLRYTDLKEKGEGNI